MCSKMSVLATVACTTAIVIFKILQYVLFVTFYYHPVLRCKHRMAVHIIQLKYIYSMCIYFITNKIEHLWILYAYCYLDFLLHDFTFHILCLLFHWMAFWSFLLIDIEVLYIYWLWSGHFRGTIHLVVYLNGFPGMQSTTYAVIPGNS